MFYLFYFHLFINCFFMTFNICTKPEFSHFSLDDIEQELIDNQQLDQKHSIQSELDLTNTDNPHVGSQISMENLGNIQNSFTNLQVNKYKLKQTQNTTILVAKTIKVQETETLSIFKRIYEKVVSSYLKQISSQEKKFTQRILKFQACGLFSNLNLELTISSVSQIINRTDFQFIQKAELMDFFDTFSQLKLFVFETLSSGFEEISNEFIYLIKMLIDELKPFIFKQENINSQRTISENKDDSKNTGQNLFPESTSQRKKSISAIQKDEKSMKKILEESYFTDKVFYDKKIKYLNCRQIVVPAKDQKVKQSFTRFIRLYSHLIIKLMSIEFIQRDIENKTAQKEADKQSAKTINQSCDYIGNWFLSNSCAKSFNSINSLNSINLNNINDVKIYSSKPDLWSQNQDQDCDNFSNQQEQMFSKKKRKI